MTMIPKFTQKERTRIIVVTISVFLIIVAIVVIALLGTYAAGSTDYSTPENYDKLISTAKLMQLQGDDSNKLCIIDASFDYDIYESGHINDAQFFNRSVIHNETNNELFHRVYFEHYIRTLGVDVNCHVIIYDSGVGQLGMMNATWVWWVMRSFNHEWVSVLDGGLYAWRIAQGALQTKVTEKERGNFFPEYTDILTVTYDEAMEAVRSDSQILDVRPASEFKPSHVMGAVNFYVENMFANHIVVPMHSANNLTERLGNLGINIDKPVIVYATSGRMSTAGLFVLKEYNYDAKIILEYGLHITI